MNEESNLQSQPEIPPDEGPVGRYNYYCSKCGFSMSGLTKPAWNTTKRFHKKTGCNLQKAPDKGGFILARPQLAAEATVGKTIVEVAREHGEELREEAQMQQVQNYLDPHDSPSE